AVAFDNGGGGGGGAGGGMGAGNDSAGSMASPGFAYTLQCVELCFPLSLPGIRGASPMPLRLRKRALSPPAPGRNGALGRGRSGRGRRGGPSGRAGGGGDHGGGGRGGAVAHPRAAQACQRARQQH
ncbi:unnamed protein product, partial [Phaeothamnion confervicola]